MVNINVRFDYGGSAEKCGIIIEGQDKWKTVIENAKVYSCGDR